MRPSPKSKRKDATTLPCITLQSAFAPGIFTRKRIGPRIDVRGPRAQDWTQEVTGAGMHQVRQAVEALIAAIETARRGLPRGPAGDHGARALLSRG